MTDVQVTFLPHILWKIKGVTRFCKVKGPEITVLGARWKLKFVYASSVKGNRCSVILKRSTDCNRRGWRVKISTALRNIKYELSSTVSLNESPDKEMIIWEETVISILNSCVEYSTIKSTLQNAYFKIHLCLESDWIEKDVCSETKQRDTTCEPYSSCTESLKEDFGKMFNNHLMSDISLQCGDRTIYAHRAILAARSEVFAAMFRSGMVEDKNQCVVITDIEPDILDLLVRYMYSGKIYSLSEETVDKLYAASDKYGVNALKMKCCVFMVDSDNAKMEVASSVVGYSGEKTVRSHFANIKAVLGTDEWKKLSVEEPKFAYKAFQFFVSENPS